MSYTALAAVGICATKLFFVDFFMSYRLYYIWSGNEHVALFFHHEDEVCKSRRIARTSGTRAKDSGNLRNNARSDSILIEDRRITRDTAYDFLYAGTTRVVQRDNWRSVLKSQLLYLYNFLRSGNAQCSAVNGEIVSVNVYQTSVYFTVSAYDTVARNMILVHTKIGTVMDNQLIKLIESTLIEQHVDALACSHVSVSVLSFHTVYPTALRSQFIKLLKFLILFCCCHN